LEEIALVVNRQNVLGYYSLFPFEKHPYWTGVLEGRFTKSQILNAEIQHFIRSNIGREFRRRAAEEAKAISERAHTLLHETYREECTDECGTNHLGLIRQFLNIGGISDHELAVAVPTPGNAAAIALYKEITDRGPLHHMIGAGAVEFYYSSLSPKIFEAYIGRYNFTAKQAETYRIHGPMDREHAERALSILGESYVQANSESIMLAVRDAFVATSLHYDGMLQAAVGSWAHGIDIKSVVDSVHFCRSHHSRLIQLADIYAWLVTHRWGKRTGDMAALVTQEIKDANLFPDRYKYWPN
jgi:pyrroloquinoline quinone (PQQ) biosynthesis protein C